MRLVHTSTVEQDPQPSPDFMNQTFLSYVQMNWFRLIYLNDNNLNVHIYCVIKLNGTSSALRTFMKLTFQWDKLCTTRLEAGQHYLKPGY